MEDILEVKVKLKVSDVFRYNMYVGYRGLLNKIFLFIGFILAGYVVYKFGIRQVSIGVFASQNIVWIILSVFMLIGKPLKIWKITAIQMQSPIFASTSIYIFQKEHIYIELADLKDTVPWETYSKIIETKKDFRLFVNPVQAQIIPKHVMNNEQIDKLREIIKQANPTEIYKLKG
ncbi:hypothetical protein AN639_12775 [Candidatus Epulonipiscium fishelsonii]|uniref:Uncharacterized protein n=1 Tax=Candidatus Epulonipiscium fishelsonii TaxID=77094 RepID=A0ACC8XCG4_9FIRM|nr:hypothetical protein AN396_06250 [Epulopiscium sp. SCG-B11WGA-EpuloA1]ONI42225.1 hypothetical protein AN639_12775 [Epulopiscium sp. SCG-B05WGA-EpuloA1]